MCFLGVDEEVLTQPCYPSLQRSFAKSEERQSHPPPLAQTPPFFRGGRVALLAARDRYAEQSHHIFLLDKEKQQSGLLEETESFF